MSMDFAEVSKYEVQEDTIPFEDVSTSLAYEECINTVLTKPPLPEGEPDSLPYDG